MFWSIIVYIFCRYFLKVDAGDRDDANVDVGAGLDEQLVDVNEEIVEDKCRYVYSNL